MRRLLLTPMILAAVGCASDESMQLPEPLPQELVDIIAPPPPPAATVPQRRRAGRTGYATKRDAATVYEFETDRVFPVAVSPGRSTVLQLARGEQLSRQPVIGDPDPARWLVETTRGADDFVIIRCAASGSKTNLFVTSMSADYQVDLACKAKGGMDRVRWSRPPAPQSAPAPSQPTFDPNTFSRSFEISNPSGDKPSWTPIRVYEIGGKSFIEFPPRLGPIKTAPVLYKTGGADIPFRVVNNRFYEIDTAIIDAELRLDGSVVRIKRSS